MEPPPLPFTLYSKKSKSLVLLFACIAFMAGSIMIINEGRIIGWVGAVFFGLCIPLLAIQLYSGRSFLTVSEDGIEFCSLLRRCKLRWSDISKIGTYTIKHHGMPIITLVGINFSDEYRLSSRMRAVSKALAGFEDGLPDTYGLRADELAYLLSYYHAERLAQ